MLPVVHNRLLKYVNSWISSLAPLASLSVCALTVFTVITLVLSFFNSQSDWSCNFFQALSFLVYTERVGQYLQAASGNLSDALCFFYITAVFTQTWLPYVRVFAIANPSVVCLLCVTFVRPSRGLEIFRNISSSFCTLTIVWPPCKFFGDRLTGTPFGGVKRKRDSKTEQWCTYRRLYLIPMSCLGLSYPGEFVVLVMLYVFVTEVATQIQCVNLYFKRVKVYI